MSTHLHINPYLNFNGATEEAFRFYRSIFGGEFSAMQRFGDLPPGEAPLPENERRRIMHISLPIEGGTILMGSDISESLGHKLIEGNNCYISLHPDNLDEAKRLFSALSVGGVVEMPLAKMFWGAWFASFADRFGIRWMVNFSEG